MDMIRKCFTCKKDILIRKRGKKLKTFRLDSNKKHKCEIIFKNQKKFTFYDSDGWKRIRRKVFLIYDKRCMKCGEVNNLQVDHIKPRSLYPELELDLNNMQILCEKCNKLKSNKNEIDYRLSDDIQCLVDFMELV